MRQKTKIFITQYCFAVPKTTRINSKDLIVLSKRQFKQIALNNSSTIGYEGFMYLYKKCAFLAIDTTLASDNLLRFRKNHLQIK